MHIQAEIRELILKEFDEFHFSDPEAEARRIVAGLEIQYGFRNYKTRKMAVAATRIQLVSMQGSSVKNLLTFVTRLLKFK